MWIGEGHILHSIGSGRVKVWRAGEVEREAASEGFISP